MKWIINNWKALGIGLLVIAVLASAWAAYHYYDLLQAEKEKPLFVASAQKDFEDTLAKHKDVAGNDHYTAQAGQHTFRQTTLAQNPKTSLGGADTTAQLLQIQKQQIEDWKQIALSEKADKLKAKALLDSLKHLLFSFNNGHLNLAFHPLDSTFSYHNNEDLTITQYWKRSWFLGDKKSFIDISSNDPYTTISGLKTLTIVPEQPYFNLTGQLSASYDFASGNMIPSAGVKATFGSFDFSGSYYYSRYYQKLTPILSATYNFFRLK